MASDTPRTARRPRLWVWKQTSDIESKARGSTERTLHACFHPSPSKSLVVGLLVARSGTLAKHLLGCAHQRMTGPTDREEKEKTGMEKPTDRPTTNPPTECPDPPPLTDGGGEDDTNPAQNEQQRQLAGSSGPEAQRSMRLRPNDRRAEGRARHWLAPVPLRPGVSNGRLKRQAKTGDRHHLEDGERGGGGPVYGRKDDEQLQARGRARAWIQGRRSDSTERLAEDEPSRVSQGD